MDQKTVLNIVRTFRTALEKSGIAIDQMALFGSYASGTYTDNSDIDVVVVSSDFRGLNHWQRIEKMTDAMYELFQPIEPRALTPEEWKSGDSMTSAYVHAGPLVSV